MKFYHSIRFRIVTAILLFGTLLISFNTGITFFVMGKGIDKMVTNLIETEVDSFLYKYEKDRATPLPYSKYIHMYEGIKNVPEHFKGKVTGLSPGVYTVRYMNNKPPVHVGIIQLSDKEYPYFMIFHGKEFFEENVNIRPKNILMISLALLLIPGIIIGYLTSRMLFKPVVTLMDQIKGLNPENLSTQFIDKHSTNELGMLIQTIETTMNRVNAFIQREKLFTRDASHELRTPVTIIKGAVEIMEQQPELETNQLLAKPLKRISRSVKDMETIIETFLWLAREESEPEEICLVEPVVRKAISDSQYLIENKDIVLKIDVQSNKLLQAKEEVLYITIINLIRNAFHFTTKGSVTITIDDAHICIQDTGMGIETERIDSVIQTHVKGDQSQGFGLGLSIVSRICKRFGWKLNIDSQPGKGTQVRIFWQDI